MSEKKLRPRNFPLWLLEDFFKVASMGEEKYGTYDFLKKDYTVNDHLDAAKRHLMKFESPYENDNDHESHVLHPYHAAWRCLIAAHVCKTRPELDDRYKIEETGLKSTPLTEEESKLVDELISLDNFKFEKLDQVKVGALIAEVLEPVYNTKMEPMYILKTLKDNQVFTEKEYMLEMAPVDTGE